MIDTTIKKVSSRSSPKGDMGQVCLASGKRVSMRLWRDEEPQAKDAVRARLRDGRLCHSRTSRADARRTDDQARAR